MTAEQLIADLKAQGLRPRRYAGRGMYGRECVAVSVDDPGEYPLPPGWSSDSLGMRVIVYWSSITWPEGLQED